VKTPGTFCGLPDRKGGLVPVSGLTFNVDALDLDLLKKKKDILVDRQKE